MTLHYQISFSDAQAHLIDVTLTLSSPNPAGQVFRLPNWIPGSYMIRDFSRNIVSISASTQDGHLSLEKLDKSTWRAAPCDGELTLQYRVYAWDLSVRAAHVDQTHAFFNGTSVFLSAEGMENTEHTVLITRPCCDTEERFKLSTTLTAC